jgi:hypothetical protein
MDTSKNDALPWIKTEKFDDSKDKGQKRPFPTMGHKKPHAYTQATGNPRKPFKVVMCMYACMCVYVCDNCEIRNLMRTHRLRESQYAFQGSYVHVCMGVYACVFSNQMYLSQAACQGRYVQVHINT